MKLDYQKCKHCKYFIQHYNIDYSHIWKVCCGHCIKQPDPNRFRMYSGKQPCPYFEQNKGQKTKLNKHRLVDLVTELNYTVENIKLFLNRNSNSQPISDLMIEKLKNIK